MKCLVSLCITMVLLSSMAFARPAKPIDKGSLILGGTVGLENRGGDLYTDSHNNTETILTLSPSAAYFFIPGLAFGAQLQYTNDAQGSFEQSNLGLGPTATYYFDLDKARTEVSGSAFPYVGAFMLYNHLSYKGQSYSFSGTTFGARGGVDIMLSKAVALDAGVFFRSDSWKPSVSGSESVSGTRLGVNVGISAFVW